MTSKEAGNARECQGTKDMDAKIRVQKGLAALNHFNICKAVQ